MLYVFNYVIFYVKDELVCMLGVGDVLVWGVGEYLMWVWFEFVKVVVCGLIVSDVVVVICE